MVVKYDDGDFFNLMVINLKAWESIYSDDALDDARNLQNEIVIIDINDFEMLFAIGDYKVTAYMTFNNPFPVECNCNRGNYCKHCAAVLYYIQDNPDLIITNKEHYDIDIEFLNLKLDNILNLQINAMSYELFSFLEERIHQMLNNGYYEFVCGLLCKIAEVISDVGINEGIWFDIEKYFLGYSYFLTESLCLEYNQVKELEFKTHEIENLIYKR